MFAFVFFWMVVRSNSLNPNILVVSPRHPDGKEYSPQAFLNFETKVAKAVARRRIMLGVLTRSQSGKGSKTVECPDNYKAISCGMQDFINPKSNSGPGYEKFPKVYSDDENSCTCYNYYGSDCYVACIEDSMDIKRVTSSGSGHVTAKCDEGYFATGCAIRTKSTKGFEKWPAATFDSKTSCRCYNYYGADCTAFCMKSDLVGEHYIQSGHIVESGVVTCDSGYTALGCGFAADVGGKGFEKWPAYYLQGNQCHFYDHYGVMGSVSCAQQKQECYSVEVNVEDYTVVEDTVGAPEYLDTAEQTLKNCDHSEPTVMTVSTTKTKKESFTDKWSFTSSLSETFTESIGVSATVGISAKAFGVTSSFSATFSNNMEWKTTNTATSTEGTAKHTEDVHAFTTAATVTVPAHGKTQIKVVIQKRTADVSWHGHAVCKDQQGNVLQTKFIDGMWHGAAIHTNDYSVGDLTCDDSDDNLQSFLATGPSFLATGPSASTSRPSASTSRPSVSTTLRSFKKGRRNSWKKSRRSMKRKRSKQGN